MKTQTVMVGEKEFPIPSRLPFGVIRTHPKAFVVFAQIKEFSAEHMLGGAPIDAMAEIVHASIESIDPSVTLEQFNAALDALDFDDGFKVLAEAAGQLMKTRRAGATSAGESESSQSATSPVSAG